MQASVTFTGTQKEITTLLNKLGDEDVATLSSVKTSADVPADEAPKKRGRPAKAAAPVEAPEETEEETEEEDGQEEETETEPEVPAVRKGAKAAKGLTLDADIIPAFQKFVAGDTKKRGQAQKILKKYGVESVRALPVEKYAEVLKALNA